MNKIKGATIRQKTEGWKMGLFDAYLQGASHKEKQLPFA